MDIVFFSSKSYDRDYFNRYVTDNGHKLTFLETSLTLDTAELARGYRAACLFVNDRADRDVLQRLSEAGVELIALRCAGFNHVDLEAADEVGIQVVRVPAYSPEAVAEHAVALILTLNRKTHKAFNRVRENNFSLERLTGFNLFKKCVGVIGTGQIGSAFCKIMLGFGCKVIATDPVISTELKEAGVQYTGMDHLLEESDIISLHCPLTPQTKHLIDHKAIEKMKRGVMLINTGRGGLVQTQDVIDSLKSSKIGYLGIDVYEQEEHLFFRDLSEFIIQDDMIARLISFPNVLITAHQGFFTREALDEIAAVTMKNIEEFEAGMKLSNAVTGGS